MKQFILGLITAAIVLMPVGVIAQVKDDWKLRISKCPDDSTSTCSADVYIKEWSPNNDTVCYVASANTYNYGAGANVGISCVKRTER